jgi:hypothetical protein
MKRKPSSSPRQPEVRVTRITGEDTPEAYERLKAGLQLIYRAAARLRRENPDEYARIMGDTPEK